MGNQRGEACSRTPSYQAALPVERDRDKEVNVTPQQELTRFNADWKYFRDHYQELLAQYPEQWIAIYEGKVVGTATELSDLIDDLIRQGIHPGSVYHDFLTNSDDLLIVPVDTV